jgi:hypothetical protein
VRFPNHVAGLQLLMILAFVAGQNLGDDAVDAQLARDRIGGALVMTGQEHHLDALQTIDKGDKFFLYQPP